MRTITTLALTLALAVGLVSAQTEPDLIDIDYLTMAEARIVEVEWAGDEPYGDTTGTFDGRCSVPSHFLAHGEGDMINFPMGRHVFRFVRFCGLLTWGVDAAGERTITDLAFPDGEYGIDGPGGAYYTARFASVGTDVDPLTGALLPMLEHIDLTASGIALPGLSFVSGELGGPTIVYDVEAFLEGALPTVTLVQGVVRFAPEAQETIDLEMVNVNQYRVTDVRWAGEEPFSGETSTFDGRCSIPSEYVRTGTFAGLTFPIGHGEGTGEQCGRFVRETDADGRIVIRGDLTSDGVGRLESVDGSILTMSYDAASAYDPVLGMVVYTMAVHIDDMTAPPGLSFVSGSMEATYAIPDLEALMTGAIEAVGVVIGSASFTPVATD